MLNVDMWVYSCQGLSILYSKILYKILIFFTLFFYSTKYIFLCLKRHTLFKKKKNGNNGYFSHFPYIYPKLVSVITEMDFSLLWKRAEKYIQKFDNSSGLNSLSLKKKMDKKKRVKDLFIKKSQISIKMKAFKRL